MATRSTGPPTDPATKLEPLTVSVNAGPTAGVEFGLKVLIEGPGGMIVKFAELDDAPPGLTTVMVAVPCEAIRLSETEAVNWLPLTNTVASVDPFRRTPAPA